MFDERTTLRVGSSVLALLIGSLVIALLIGKPDWGRMTPIKIFMSHLGPLQQNADIQIGGRIIGSVRSIRLVTSREAQAPRHPLHPKGGIVLDARISRKYLNWVRMNSEIFVNAKGLLNQPYLEVAPPPFEQPIMRKVRNGDHLRGTSPAQIEKIVVLSVITTQRASALFRELAPSVASLRTEASELNMTLGAIRANVPDYQQLHAEAARAAQEISKLRNTVARNKKNLVALVSQLSILHPTTKKSLATITDKLRIFRMSLKTLQHNLTPQKIQSFRDNLALTKEQSKASVALLTKTLSNIERLREYVSSGLGTIGALLHDEEFVDDRKKLGRYLKRHPWEFLTRPFDN